MRAANPNLPGFLHAIDLWRVPGATATGSGYWARLDTPVVAGEPQRSTAFVTFAFDCANVMGIDNPMANVTMINPDVTAHVLRPPADEWVAVTGETFVDRAMGRSMTVATYSDSRGMYAHGSLSQLVQPTGSAGGDPPEEDVGERLRDVARRHRAAGLQPQVRVVVHAEPGPRGEPRVDGAELAGVDARLQDGFDPALVLAPAVRNCSARVVGERRELVQEHPHVVGVAVDDVEQLGAEHLELLRR